ncbi:MAG: hypothetical protein LIO46_02360, partial [Clostridiales bacterium]|nr:hypothetical protein [Clostridiales bacterium]
MALSFSFDAMGQYETPVLTLCNPQGNQLDIMGQVQDLVYTPAFNGLSELSLRIPKTYTDADGPKEIPYYDKAVKNRLILAEGIGWFVIDSEKEQNDGMSVYKEIQASSYEVTLNRLETNIPDGTHQFYNATSPADSLMGMVAALLPDWSIGRISTDLWSRYRTFEIDNSTPLYSFLMEEVEEAYECVFDFDTLNKTISAYTPEEAVETTDIFLSLDNLVKVVNVETTSDPLITALSVTGDDSLDITLVNPMGTTMIYDFSYFKDPKWMSDALIAALDKWEAKFDENQPKYADLLAQYKDKNSQLVTLRSELVDLESAYAALETTRTEYIAQGQTDLRSITSQIESNKTARKNKQAEIDRAQTDLQNLHNSLSAISQSLQFENNFSDEELRELHHFMHSNTYQNSNFSVTESMDPMEQQELAQELYDQGINILHKLCQPNYTFSLEMVNFLMLPEFQSFIRQTQLGRTVHVEIRDGLWFKPVLLKAEIHYDDPSAMKLTFSNKLRLDDAAWTLEELLGEATKTSNKVSYSGLSWKKAAEQTDIVTEYMKNALDLANQHIQNNNNQEILINEYGIWGTRLE